MKYLTQTFTAIITACALVLFAGSAHASGAGSITICKVILDPDGAVVDGSEVPGVTFEVLIGDEVDTDAGTPAGDTQSFSFETPLTYNGDVIEGEGNDAECVTYDDLEITDTGYYYGKESVPSGWATPLYTDGLETPIPIADLDEHAFPYEDQLFDDDPGNDNPRNKNADGHIRLTHDRPDRTLVIVNQYTEKPDDDKDNDKDKDKTKKRGGDIRTVVISDNSAYVTNAAKVSANTGGNDAYGGSSHAGDGGNVSLSDDKNTGGHGGDAGRAGDGTVVTGDAYADSVITSVVNSNVTRVRGCDCAETGSSSLKTKVFTRNDASVANFARVKADTGKNRSFGGTSSAGDGGKVSGSDDKNTGGDGGHGARAGDGTVSTGHASAFSDIFNVVNENTVRIRR